MYKKYEVSIEKCSKRYSNIYFKFRFYILFVFVKICRKMYKFVQICNFKTKTEFHKQNSRVVNF